MKLISVLSGGMDSATALGIFTKDIIAAISFNYGSKHNDQEWIRAAQLAAHYNIPIKRVHLDFIADNFKSDLLKSGGEVPEGHYEDPSMKRTVVPFRNGIMLSIAAGFAESIGAEGIILGNHAGDHAIYPDCRSDFTVAMGDAIRRGTYARIHLQTPFQFLSKAEIAKMGHNANVPYEKTYSCYKGRELHCGRCGTCYERKEAFRMAGVNDPTEYETA